MRQVATQLDTFGETTIGQARKHFVKRFTEQIQKISMSRSQVQTLV